MKKRVLLTAVLAVTVLFSACKPYVPNELSWLTESEEIMESLEEQSEESQMPMDELMDQIESANDAASNQENGTSEDAQSGAESSKNGSTAGSSSSQNSSSSGSSSTGGSSSSSGGSSSGGNSSSSGGGSSSTGGGSSSQTATMRGVWISYLELAEFAGSSQSAFTTKIASMMKKCKQEQLNTVFVQVRPFGDAIYPSKLFPWSRTVSGQTGKALSYDPLQIIVTQAKAQGLSVHAWINPYRLMDDTNMKKVDDSYAIGKWYQSSNRSNYMVNVNGTWWLKPGNTEARNLIVNGAKELLSNYAIDGIHIDDYFYAAFPSVYGDTTSQAKSYNTALVKALYQAVKSVRSSAQFGVSPAGGFLKNNSVPSSDINYLSTDLALWCRSSGYIDYVMPQIYWDYSHATQPFTMTIEKWKAFVTSSSVKLYIGLASYKYGDDIIDRQKADSVSGKASGWCLYRYAYM